MKLVIVESPAKGQTIERYLGKGYKVMASFGHVRDLPKSVLGVEVDRSYEPKYIVPAKSKKVVSELKKEIKNAEVVYLATDYDREGEAIAWHIKEALNLDNSKNTTVKRITFHEITQSAIKEAVAHPRELDYNLIDAQQARRVLDRLVGYKLSPFLWKKVYKGLSAGRVQSVTVRLVVDREREILAFVPTEYWSIEADLLAGKVLITASLVACGNKKIDKMAIINQEQANLITQDLKNAQYKVSDLIKKTINRHPYPPFTTSTLQQTASHQLGFSAKRTMVLAQQLYEAGHITYMRTDSVNLSSQAVSSARDYISSAFGAPYLPPEPRLYKTRSKGAQEAHEAIRPTSPASAPPDLAMNVPDDQRQLYELIWKRLIACQMASARFEQISLEVAAAGNKDSYMFRATGQNVIFDGFLHLWQEKLEVTGLPDLEKGSELVLQKLRHDQHFTEPPPRYNEASIIKALEEFGIGRPSTYAPTISTIVDRGYVKIENRQLQPQEVGFIVIDLLKEHFPNIVDIGFTATMEENLDNVAEGKKVWTEVIDEFYRPFIKLLTEKEVSVLKRKTEEATDEVCEKCGQPMVIKLGRFGRFLACTGFPDCRNTKAILKTVGRPCPTCAQGELAERTTKRHRHFWGCSRYPECDYATWDDPHKPAKTKPGEQTVPEGKENEAVENAPEVLAPESIAESK